VAKLPDSGERREFSTGSVRDKVDGKGSFHLLSPFALRAYAKRMQDGMTKYGTRNWEKGQPIMTFLDSALRHINDYVADCMTGEVPHEDHLGAALWNIAAAIHTGEMIDRGLLPEDLDDRPKPPPPPIYNEWEDSDRRVPRMPLVNSKVHLEVALDEEAGKF
jgi:hypothetical protein